jgi:S-adenosylmethionine decarboxylase
VLIRGWAIAVPLAIALAWLPHDATTLGDASYQDFWWNVGDSFPVLTGARSTTYYFENEKRLIAEAMPDLAGRAILKTDLWDEAKNTRILQWVADRGARVYGIDISEPIVREAQDAFGDRILRSAISDVRQVPFADGSFDAIYSMGTVEHFAETEASVRELARVLKPGGRLILGVPNRHDPFLRPAMVWVLSRLGLYGYGFEKSFSRRALRLMLERAGLAVTLESGILFMPGWLRMLDLWCHTRVTGLSWFTGAMVAPFAWLDARVPALRRHGYLIASVGVKEIAADGVANIVPVRRTNGVEYVVDARGCDPERLRSRARLAQFFDEVIRDLDLHPVSAPVWHVFPSPGGITGVVLLAESHLTIHTYPETRLATINLYCCRGSADWDWDRHLHRLLGAGDTSVRLLRRPLRPYTS